MHFTKKMEISIDPKVSYEYSSAQNLSVLLKKS